MDPMFKALGALKWVWGGFCHVAWLPNVPRACSTHPKKGQGERPNRADSLGTGDQDDGPPLPEANQAFQPLINFLTHSEPHCKCACTQAHVWYTRRLLACRPANVKNLLATHL